LASSAATKAELELLSEVLLEQKAPEEIFKICHLLARYNPETFFNLPPKLMATILENGGYLLGRHYPEAFDKIVFDSIVPVEDKLGVIGSLIAQGHLFAEHYKKGFDRLIFGNDFELVFV